MQREQSLATSASIFPVRENLFSRSRGTVKRSQKWRNAIVREEERTQASDQRGKSQKNRQEQEVEEKEEEE